MILAAWDVFADQRNQNAPSSGTATVETTEECLHARQYLIIDAGLRTTCAKIAAAVSGAKMRYMS